MGLWETLRARREPRRNNLDALFAVPSAAIHLEAALGFVPTGWASVCYRAASGAAFAQTEDELVALIGVDGDGPAVTVTRDDFGFTWLTLEGDPSDVTGMCTDLHAVNTTLESNGFQSGLLCSMVVLESSAGQRCGLVYLYKQGTFYPFAPDGDDSRDTLLELSLRDLLINELPMEPDLHRWLAVWKAPGL